MVGVVLPPGYTPDSPFGSEFTDAEIELRQFVRTTIEAIYGIQGLLSGAQEIAQIAAWRIATRRTFNPLSRLIADEARLKLNRSIDFNPKALIPAAEVDAARTLELRARAYARIAGAVGEGVNADDVLRRLEAMEV